MQHLRDTPVRLGPEHLFADAGPAVPIMLIGNGASAVEASPDPTGRHWLQTMGFSGATKKTISWPDLAGDGSTMGGVALGVGQGDTGEPCGPACLLVGQLAQTLPAGTYALAAEPHKASAALTAVAWGLGAYRFHTYKSAPPPLLPRLVWPQACDRACVLNTIEAVWLGRDLINTPANDLGPDELEHAVRTLAGRHGATVSAIVGDDLLAQNFPLIHAVGRASSRAPRLIDLTWGAPDAPKVTIVGKGIVFDTGGLDIKSAGGMLLMKKDMGGAATALALAHMIMGQRLPVRLRVLIPAAENAIGSNAFRPSDVIASRAGTTVEVGNTDAEGRLVLADAIALADEETPDQLFTFATLTGAARVALGPDLPAFFTDDEVLAASLAAAGRACGDPAWRLPLWTGYETALDSEIADMNNVSESPFSGAIIAALFLRRFVKRARCFAHFDLYGWRPASRALGPKGGEPHCARAVMDVLRSQFAS